MLSLIPEEKLFVARAKEDKFPYKGRYWFATQTYTNRFEVYHHRMWRPFFTHELEDIIPVKVVVGSDK